MKPIIQPPPQARSVILPANPSLLKLAGAPAALAEMWSVPGQWPAAVAPGTQNILVSRVAAKRLHQRVRQEYQT